MKRRYTFNDPTHKIKRRKIIRKKITGQKRNRPFNNIERKRKKRKYTCLAENSIFISGFCAGMAWADDFIVPNLPFDLKKRALFMTGFYDGMQFSDNNRLDRQNSWDYDYSSQDEQGQG